ncbi:hypothetical protein T484DRAFT_1817030 [Baffinella frigidus]|nr:hypothetical protein T484DRAFT_1817030 [Cryptophyta sp. CCMP2293]
MEQLSPGKEDEELAVALQTLTRQVLGEMTGRQLANTLHSTATLHVAGRARADDELVQQLASRSLEVLRTQPGSFNSQGVANTMWALGKLGAKVDQELAKAMQRRAIEIAATFNSQGVSNLVWALATLEVEVDPQLVTVMQDRAIGIVDKFNSQDISNLVWALAKLEMGVYPALAKAMKRRSTEIAATFKPQEVANTMWALATLGVEVDPQLATVMQDRAIKIADGFNSQNVANLVWAGTCFDLSAVESTPAFFDSMAARIFNLLGSQNPADQFTAADKSQLHQWFLSCQIDDSLRGRLPESVMLLIETLGEECRAALPYSGNGSSESRLQEDVCAALERTFPEMEILWEYREPTSWYSIDMLVRSRSAGDVDPSETRGGGHLGYAVEVDGPTHFLELRQLGYTVVSVPFWEWRALKGGQEQEEYLHRKFM